VTRGALAILVSALFVVGCSTTGPGGSSPSSSTSTAPSPPAAADLTVYAAASLAGVLGEAKNAYEAAVPGTTVTISTDSSAALEMQIEQGAPADVFLAADTTHPEKLVDGGFAAADPVVFAGNQLTVIVPDGNPGKVLTPADLARSGLRVIAAGDEVPITRYAAQLVSNLAKEPGYPAGFESAYKANVVSKEDNVRAVVAKVALGEGDAGIVYDTDAKASSDVATIDVPERANVPASYAGVVVKASTHIEAATAFLDWFGGPDGQAILEQFGFLPPDP
jgi:molybdate transport system substrate-binding protein